MDSQKNMYKKLLPVVALLLETTNLCACLGAVFNLPMSTITIIEETPMVAMSGLMLFSHI